MSQKQRNSAFGTPLKVPFREKDEAKVLGAWWDPVAKTWYVPPGKDLRAFDRWLPKDERSSAPRAGSGG